MSSTQSISTRRVDLAHYPYYKINSKPMQGGLLLVSYQGLMIADKTQSRERIDLWDPFTSPPSFEIWVIKLDGGRRPGSLTDTGRRWRSSYVIFYSSILLAGRSRRDFVFEVLSEISRNTTRVDGTLL